MDLPNVNVSVGETQLKLEAPRAFGSALRGAAKPKAIAPKLANGANRAHGEIEGQAVRSTSPKLAAGPDARTFLAATIESCLAQISGNLHAVSAGTEDEEYVHQLRIGLRRLRTALRELRAERQGADPAWERSLRSVFQELGRHRDCAIVMPAICLELDAAGIPTGHCSESASLARSPKYLVRDVMFRKTLLGLEAFVRDQELISAERSGKGEGVQAFVTKRLEALHRRLSRDAKRFVKLDAHQQHRVRKRLKRLRYLSEFAAPLFASVDVAGYLGNWRDAQDALGEYNDQRIATEAFRKKAHKESKAKLAIGWLKTQGHAVVERCGRTLLKASKTAPFWNS